MTLDCSPELKRPLRGLEQACKQLGRRNPLSCNDNVETDVGTHGLDDIDGTLPMVKLAIPLAREFKEQMEAFRHVSSGSAANAAFNDAIGWAGEILEDLENTEKAFTETLRDWECG